MFTVIGATGFIGKALFLYLRGRGHFVNPLDRLNELPTKLGHVVDCGGLTSDFRTRKHELFEAHVSRIDRLLNTAKFSSYLYLSSTRIYKNSTRTHEDDPLEVVPSSFDDSYNISKIAGEAVCLIRDNPTIRVARLSNVLGENYDPAVFLTSLLLEARTTGHVVLRESADSSKDYIAVEDVCRYIEEIAMGGRHRIYNLAFGHPVTHARVLDCLAANLQFTYEAPAAPIRAFPRIDNSRLVEEFGPPQVTPEAAIHNLCALLTA